MPTNVEQQHLQKAFEQATKARFRLGLYDPVLGEDGEIEWTGPIFRDTLRDRATMQQIIERFNQITASNQRAKLCIAVFPWGR